MLGQCAIWAQGRNILGQICCWLFGASTSKLFYRMLYKRFGSLVLATWRYMCVTMQGHCNAASCQYFSLLISTPTWCDIFLCERGHIKCYFTQKRSHLQLSLKKYSHDSRKYIVLKMRVITESVFCRYVRAMAHLYPQVQHLISRLWCMRKDVPGGSHICLHLTQWSILCTPVVGTQGHLKTVYTKTSERLFLERERVTFFKWNSLSVPSSRPMRRLVRRSLFN